MVLLPDGQLTDEQQRAVADLDRPVRIGGGAGTGKTTVLVARYQALLRRTAASSVLVLCRSRQAASRVLAAVLPDLAGGFDTLPVTTFHGLAFDLVRRYHGDLTLLTGAEHRRMVAGLLAREERALWPTLHHLRRRRAFIGEVSAAVVELQGSLLSDDEVRSRAQRAGVPDRWEELLAFRSRYVAELATARAVDHAGLLSLAAGLLHRNEVFHTEGGRFRHVLVDDFEAPMPAADRILSRLVALGATPTVTGNPDAARAVDRTHEPGPRHFLGPFAGTGDADDVHLSQPFRHPAPPALVQCAHPAVEPEAVAGILQVARAEGTAWGDMAVLVRRSGERARAVARALGRHGIPVAPVPGPVAAEPTVAAVLDMLRWVNGDDGALIRLMASPVAGLDPADVRAVRREAASQGTPLDHPALASLASLRADLRSMLDRRSPADLAFEIWQRALAELAGPERPDQSGERGPERPDQSGEPGPDGATDERALDALVSFHSDLRRRSERHPDERLGDFLASLADGEASDLESEPWRALTPTTAVADVVTVTTMAQALGREWHTVVLAGCVEGELPRLSAPLRLFDCQLLGAAPFLAAAERRQCTLAHERRLFAAACATATSRLRATAGSEPGVLLSRFVEGWAPEEPCLPLAPGPRFRALPPTAAMAVAAAGGSLRLSASQLATYDDCPLRYSYRYVLGARDEGSVHTALGTLVHEVLAAFHDPREPSGFPPTREGLMALAEERWRDDIARYRPQVEEARRDYFAMLDGWWEAEGSQAELAPQVLEVERHFDVEVGPHRLRGAIDRIDRSDDGEGVRIVDYKTGKAQPTAERVAEDLQLAIYHLAASRDADLAAQGPPKQLRLLYLRSMRTFEQEIGPDHERVTEQRVLERAAQIEAERFEPSVDATCRTCSFQRLCPLHDEGRQLA